MVKPRAHSTKKAKTTSATKRQPQRSKKAAPKRAAKHAKSNRSKRSHSTSSSSSASLPSAKKAGHRKGKAPSGFNLYMKSAVSKVKQDHPGIGHKDAFKKAAEQWAQSPDNPKNEHHH